MGSLRVQEIETYRTRSRSFGADPMPYGLFGILGHEGFELCPGFSCSR
jgi:hypothetical protein